MSLTNSQSSLDSGNPIQRSVFRNLFLSMIAFGIMVGLIFPPFARVVLNSPRALSPVFFLMCVLAGFIVGLVNFLLFKFVVSKELARLVEGMRHVLKSVADAENTGNGCEDCTLEVTSQDAIGDIQGVFNDMTAAIARRLKLEGRWRALHTHLAVSVELEDVAKTILDTVIDLSEAKAGLLYGKHGKSFILLADCGIDQTSEIPNRINNEYGPINRALEEKTLFSLSPDKDGLEWFNLSTPFGQLRPQTLTAIPFITKDQPVGLALIVGDADELDQDQFQIIETLCMHSGPYLQNALLHKRIRDLAAVDDLTNILNRRFGFRRLKEEFSRSVRHGVPVSVLMMDVDHFKKFNDTFGHDAGDAVLRTLASTMESVIRSGDVVCRYGGEEFMIVAPGTGLNDCATMAERIRRIIETTQIHWGDQNLSVTVSIGTAIWPMERVSSAEELISAADKALYAAKTAGRNQVFVTQGDLTLPALELPDILTNVESG